jgi:hypothetical protein
MTDESALSKLTGPVKELVERFAAQLNHTAEALAKLVLEKEREIPPEHRGTLDRQFGAVYAVLVELQPAAADQAFAPPGSRKKKDSRPRLPEWAPETFGLATVVTTAVELPDGRILEQIVTKDGPAFVEYTPVPERWRIVPELEVDRTRYVPKPVEPAFMEVITLPDGIEPYESLPKLADDMETLGLDVFDPGDDLPMFRLMMRLALSSWAVGPIFPPRYLGGTTDRYVPGLQAIGFPQTGKGRRLMLAQHLFYRSIYLLSTIRVPSIFRAASPWGWGATLILDEADLPYSGTSSELVEFLNARCYGKPPVRYNSDKDDSTPFLTFGYTLIATRQPYDDAGWNSRAIPYTSASSLRGNEPPLVVNREWESRAARLRRQLLLFRFRIITAIRSGDVRVPDRIPLARHFEPRLRAAFLPLFAIAGFDKRLTEDAVGLATEIARRQTATRADSWEGVVLNHLYEKIHDATWKPQVQSSGAFTGSYRLVAEKPADRAGDEPTEEPVTLGVLRSVLPGEPKSKAVARVIKSIPMQIQAQDRPDGKHRVWSILVVDHPNRLVDAFSKYVVEPDLAGIRGLFGISEQRTLDDPEAATGPSEGGPQ